jgi:hypothetical protein
MEETVYKNQGNAPSKKLKKKGVRKRSTTAENMGKTSNLTYQK